MKKLNRFPLLFSVLFLFVFPFFLQAQQVYELDINKSIDIALEKSYTIKVLKADLAVAEYSLQSATRSFRTHMNLQLTIPNYTETISQWEDSSGINYFPVKQLSYSSGANLWQPLPTDGRIYFSSAVYNTDDYNKDEKLLRFNNRIGLEQPLEALYSYNEIRSEFKKAELNFELSSKQLKRAELDLVYDISGAFYGLVAAKERRNISYQSLLRQDETYQIAQKKYESGLIREVEALQMEVDLAEARNNYDQSVVNYLSISNDFKHKIGISLHDSVVVISDLTYETVFVDIQKAVELGLQSRQEIREKEIQLELNELVLKQYRSDGLVKGKISAYYDFTGVDQANMPINFNDAFDNSWQDLRRRPSNRGIQLSITVPILDWGENRSRVNAQKARLSKAVYALDETKTDIEKEIINTVNKLNSSLRRLKLLEKNVEVAEKTFAISNARFINGDIDSESLALERARLNNAYVTRLEAFSSYKILLADLTRQTFYDFLNNKSLIE